MCPERELEVRGCATNVVEFQEEVLQVLAPTDFIVRASCGILQHELCMAPSCCSCKMETLCRLSYLSACNSNRASCAQASDSRVDLGRVSIQCLAFYTWACEVC